MLLLSLLFFVFFSAFPFSFCLAPTPIYIYFKFFYPSLLCFYILMYQSSVSHLPSFSTFSPFSGYPIDPQPYVSLAAIHI